MWIEELIDALSSTDEYIKTIYMYGGCYQFHLFLKKVFPQCEPYIDSSIDHVISKISGKYYDISGRIDGYGYHAMSNAERTIAEKWSFSKKMALSIGECPYCEEPILVEHTHNRA